LPALLNDGKLELPFAMDGTCHVAFIEMECKKLMVFGMPFRWFAIFDKWQMA
jgi:hypothetical protein